MKIKIINTLKHNVHLVLSYEVLLLREHLRRHNNLHLKIEFLMPEVKFSHARMARWLGSPIQGSVVRALDITKLSLKSEQSR